MSGFKEYEDHDGLGRIFVHNGSNTMWLSRVALVPSREGVIIVNTSEFNDASRQATSDLLDTLLEKIAAPR